MWLSPSISSIIHLHSGKISSTAHWIKAFSMDCVSHRVRSLHIERLFLWVTFFLNMMFIRAPRILFHIQFVPSLTASQLRCRCVCEKGCLCFKVMIVYFWTRLNRNRVLRIQLNARHQTAVRMNIQTDEKPDSSGLFIAQTCIRGGPIPPWCMAPVSTPGGKSVQKLLQVLVMANSGVNMSQHRTTSNFLSAVEEACYFFSSPILETRLEQHRGAQF